MRHEQLSQLFVGAALINETMAAQNPESIGINDECGFCQGVEQNTIGGLRLYSSLMLRSAGRKFARSAADICAMEFSK